MAGGPESRIQAEGQEDCCPWANAGVDFDAVCQSWGISCAAVRICPPHCLTVPSLPERILLGPDAAVVLRMQIPETARHDGGRDFQIIGQQRDVGDVAGLQPSQHMCQSA